MDVLVLFSALSLAVAKTVDLCRNAFDRGNAAPPWVWNVLSLGLGVIVALAWQVDLLAELGAPTSAAVWAGRVVSGLMLGGGSALGHEVLDAISGAAKRLHRAQKA